MRATLNRKDAQAGGLFFRGGLKKGREGLIPAGNVFLIPLEKDWECNRFLEKDWEEPGELAVPPWRRNHSASWRSEYLLRGKQDRLESQILWWL